MPRTRTTGVGAHPSGTCGGTGTARRRLPRSATVPTAALHVGRHQPEGVVNALLLLVWTLSFWLILISNAWLWAYVIAAVCYGGVRFRLVG